MVRIAETPAEWERIHRVLTQIGKENAAQNSEDKHSQLTAIKPSSKANVTNEFLYSATTNIVEYATQKSTTTEEIKNLSTAGHSSVSTATPSTKNNKDPDYQRDDIADNSGYEVDTGWPDFDEAIAKKVKRQRNMNDYNNIIESDWFDDEWLDTKWNDPLFGKKEKKLLDNEEKQDYQTVSFKPMRVKEIKSSVDASKIRSRLYSDPKILEFPLDHPLKLGGYNLDEEVNSSVNANKSSRPVFQYHRVTTSPQERKGNSAFIAVSVVKQIAPESTATTVTPSSILESPWINERTLFRPQDQDKQSPSNRGDRKTPHWSKAAHHHSHHSRGHRHHAHTRTHTHDHP